MAEKKPKYATAAALRAALEDRIKKIAAAEAADIQRLRRSIGFDRPLQEAAAVDLQDFFVFEIAPAMMDLDGAPYGGARFPVNVILDGRSFVRFHIDIGAGDVVLGPLDTTQSRDWLAFAGIPPAKYPTISSEQHFAEKLHAYTLPRDVPNTRVRDLVDMVLLIQSGLDKKRTTEALQATFKRRKTHAEPQELSPPPEEWKGPYSEMAEQCGLSSDIGLAFETVKGFHAGLE